MKKTLLILIGILILAPAQIGAQDLSPTLETYILQALEHNPELNASRVDLEISKEKNKEVNSLPNTEIGVGYFVSEPETRTGAQRARFSVRQMIPWFGSISARQKLNNSMTGARAHALTATEGKLVLQLSRSYYALTALSMKLKVVDSQLELTEAFKQMALSAVETGKSSAVSVLRVQIRQNELQKQQELLARELHTEQVRFNAYRGQDKNAPIQLPDTLLTPVMDEVSEEVNLTLHPELLRFDALYEVVERSEQLNQKEAAPSLGFGMDYIPVEERTDMNPSDNGKDILMPMVTLSIPLFSNKYRSVTRQHTLEKERLEYEKQEHLNTLQILYSQALDERRSAVITTRTLEKNLTETGHALDILLKNYETGSMDFDELLEIEELQLNFNLKMIDAIRSFYNQSLIINYLSIEP